MKRLILPLTGLLVVLITVLASALPSRAVTATDWNPGFIISDDDFYNSTAMTADQIQTFLNSKGATCQPGAMPCLKDYKTTTPTMPADAYCQVYVGASNETAAQIISKVGLACGINPQVLISTMQKESSLVAATAPSVAAYNAAMGYGCPDSSVCNPSYAAFFNQVYRAAWQFDVYKTKPAGTFNFYPGGTFNIRYSPNAACGSAPVTIQNWATASLYIYTPYQPNAAALANLYGVGDSCSTYGNRNFWTIFNNWFGPAATVSVTGLAVGPQSTTLILGTSQATAVSITPGNAVNKVLSWSSSNKNVATVDSNGLITAVGPGSAIVTATTTDGTNKTASVAVTAICRPFSDVPADYGFADDICWMAATGVTIGATPTTFAPSAQVTRGEMAAFLYRMVGSPAFTPPSVPRFTDVPTDSRFYKEIEWMASTGVTIGATPTTFAPSTQVTRGEMAAFLHRLSTAKLACTTFPATVGC